jgi:hypothetical protein
MVATDIHIQKEKAGELKGDTGAVIDRS